MSEYEQENDRLAAERYKERVESGLQALLDLLTPLVRQLVRDELDRREEHWRWASVRRAAELLDVTPDAIYHRISRGQLPVARVGSKVYIDLRALDHQLDPVGRTDRRSDR